MIENYTVHTCLSVSQDMDIGLLLTWSQKQLKKLISFKFQICFRLGEPQKTNAFDFVSDSCAILNKSINTCWAISKLFTLHGQVAVAKSPFQYLHL